MSNELITEWLATCLTAGELKYIMWRTGQNPLHRDLHETLLEATRRQKYKAKRTEYQLTYSTRRGTDG